MSENSKNIAWKTNQNKSTSVDKRVIDNLNFKISTNFKKCLNYEATIFLDISDIYQDFRIVGVVFVRAIHWLLGLQLKDFLNMNKRPQEVLEMVEFFENKFL